MLSLLYYQFSKQISPQYKPDLSNKTILVTGGGKGIGYETSKYLAQLNGKIVVASSNQQKGQEAVDQLKKESNNKNIFFERLDLGDTDDVKRFSDNFIQKYKQLDIMVNNSGVAPDSFNQSKQGYEQTYAINTLGVFYLTYLLQDLLDHPDKRIVNVSSYAAYMVNEPKSWEELSKNFTTDISYYYSKLGNVIINNYFSKQLKCKSVTLHPGIIKTQILDDLVKTWGVKGKFINWISFDQYTGAFNQINCVTMPQDQLQNGQFYINSSVVKMTQLQQDEKYNKELIDLMKKQCNL